MSATATQLEAKERPILFSGSMVRAILKGSKTQTRRVITPQPSDSWMRSAVTDWMQYYKAGRFGLKKHLWICHPTENREIVCPYGAPGDRLWVREAFAHLADLKTKDPGTAALMSRAFFRAEHPTGLSHDDATDLKWRPSIHMPRSVSRITLEITNVRVQRLQEISKEDCIGEGIPRLPHRDWIVITDFHQAWDGINSKRGYSWASNPWVWVIEFKRVTA